MSRPSLTSVFDRSTRKATFFGTLSNYHVFFSAALLFLLSNALFAIAAFQLEAAAVVLAGCMGVGCFIWRSRSAGRLLLTPLDPSKMGLCLALGLSLCLLGGQGHFFYAVSDWLFRDGVLADLVRDGGPTYYHYEGQSYYLRAPLGMYILPATVGRLFGLFAAHATLLLTNAYILGSILYLAGILAGGPALVFLVILIGFSGLDFIGDVTARAASLQIGDFSGQSLEWWTAPFAPSIQLQYSSMVTQIFWAPNHATPGWFIAILVLLRTREEIPLSTLIASCAPLILWSPLTVLGAVPLVAFLSARERMVFFSENLLAVAAGLGFLPIAIYLVTGANAVAHRWQISEGGFAGVYMAFLLIEIPHVVVLLYAWRKVDFVDRGVLVTAILTLIFLPVYSFGGSNDLLMRASIPSLFIVAFSFARIAVSTTSESRVLRMMILFIIFLSAVTPIVQAIRSLTRPRFAISDCNMLTVWQSGAPYGFPTNYLVPAENVPKWLLAHPESRAPARLEYRDCWPDHPYRDLLRGDWG